MNKSLRQKYKNIFWLNKNSFSTKSDFKSIYFDNQLIKLPLNNKSQLKNNKHNSEKKCSIK